MFSWMKWAWHAIAISAINQRYNQLTCGYTQGLNEDISIYFIGYITNKIALGFVWLANVDVHPLQIWYNRF